MADRSRSGRTAALVMGFLFLLLGLGGAIAAWGAYATDTRIARTGVRAEGQLLGKSISAAADGTSGHILEYRFTTADGRTVDASRTVDEELWRSFEEGDAIVISYAPENPGRSFPVGGGVTSITSTKGTL